MPEYDDIESKINDAYNNNLISKYSSSISTGAKGLSLNFDGTHIILPPDEKGGDSPVFDHIAKSGYAIPTGIERRNKRISPQAISNVMLAFLEW